MSRRCVNIGNYRGLGLIVPSGILGGVVQCSLDISEL